MTFSLIGRCTKTGAFGAAITTSDLAVGSRCVRLAHGVGAVLSQHRTDSRLGDIGITALRDGASAQAAVDRVVASTKDIGWRQIGALDSSGFAVYHGQKMYSIYAHAASADCLALGNIIANDQVPAAMAAAFEAAADEPLAERLMRALEAGREAGGEILGPLRSAALRVSGEHGMDSYDLRVDMASSDCAVADLRALFEAYRSREGNLRQVVFDPDNLPVNRQLFEASIARIAELGLEARFPTARNRDDWQVK